WRSPRSRSRSATVTATATGTATSTAPASDQSVPGRAASAARPFLLPYHRRLSTSWPQSPRGHHRRGETEMVRRAVVGVVAAAVVVGLAVGAGLGVLRWWRPIAAGVGVAGLGAIGVAAAVVRCETIVAALPSVVGAVVGGAVLWWWRPAPRPGPMATGGRRAF